MQLPSIESKSTLFACAQMGDLEHNIDSYQRVKAEIFELNQHRASTSNANKWICQSQFSNCKLGIDNILSMDSFVNQKTDFSRYKVFAIPI